MIFFPKITKNTTILTPNSRLSAVTVQNYNQWQSTQTTSWLSLDCLPLMSWIQKLWHEYSIQQNEPPALLLTPEQEQIIWEEIINASPQQAYLLQITSTAELAKAAWHTLQLWQVSFDNPALCTTEDANIFLQWAQEFKKRCELHHWIDCSSIISVLIDKIKSQEIPLPGEIILLGFTEISPLHEKLFAAIASQNCEVNSAAQNGNFDWIPAFAGMTCAPTSPINPSSQRKLGSSQNISHEVTHTPIQPPNKTHSRIALNDMESEMRCMARWAKAIHDNDPKQRVGCVIPHLEDERDKIIRIFSEVFTTENTFTLNHTLFPFNISAGKSLAAYPIIHTAIELLRINHKPLSLETLNQLLHSPFIGEAEAEMQQRNQLAVRLHKDNINEMHLNEFAKQYGHYVPHLKMRILNVLPASLEPRSILDWSTFFMEQLNLWGWPGERSVDSFEYQTIQAWLKTFADYATLSIVVNKLSYQQALQYLIYLTAQKVFQPESPATPIQILGMLEAAEIPFDYLWVMGLDDSAWPQSPNPNPFIPQQLQKKLRMPHANADRELEYGIKLTEQLKSCAPTVIFSYAEKNEDAELRPSPIITNLPLITLNDINLVPFKAYAETIFENKQLEVLTDEVGPAISPNETIRGGSSIFKLQSACPTRAFAELRLKAAKLEPPVPGLRATVKGEVLHKAMEILWSKWQTQANLLKCTAVEIENAVTSAVHQALANINQTTANKRYLELESQRLVHLITEWLEHEKARPPFAISQLEQETKINIANLSVNLRIDRIDRLENGDEIIIDYKTGKTSPAKDWFSDRPNEPQLPLYCSQQLKPQAILFAQINAEEMKWKGVCAYDIGINQVKNIADERSTEHQTWAAQTSSWEHIMETLAVNFSMGKAYRHPKSEDTCQHCHLKQFCRLHETINE